MASTSESDLPLEANIADICIPHYGLSFDVNFATRLIEGVTVAFVEPVNNSAKSSEALTIILDARYLSISTVEIIHAAASEVEAYLLSAEAKRSYSCFASWLAKPRSELPFCVKPWSLQIWTADPTISNSSSFEYPRAICITYTTPNAKENISTLWRTDQDSNPCLFTPGCWINNRSLFPCQDAPTAMATWQCIIKTPTSYVALTTGDTEPETRATNDNSYELHYSYTRMVLPMCTFAIAVGKYTIREVPLNSVTNDRVVPKPVNCLHIPYPCLYQEPDSKPLRFRLISPVSCVERIWTILKACIPSYVSSLQQILGPYPFSKTDLLVLPRSFSNLGLANPSLFFLSPSLFEGESGNLAQLAHELSHSYFGITIGPRNWSEEWLSEGFATFLEDAVHEQWLRSQNAETHRHWRSLRALNKYHTLKLELEHSDESLQSLRPMGDAVEAMAVPNAARVDKPFLQVHYLKGYFFLLYLASRVGFERFLKFLRNFVEKYHGCLITSKDLLCLYFETFPGLLNKGSLTVDSLCSTWLDKAGLPPEMDVLLAQLLNENSLVQEVNTHFTFWRNRAALRRKRKLNELAGLDKLLSDALVMLMDKLLRNDIRLSHGDLEKLALHYQMLNGNVDVLHRWCELVISHRYKKGLHQVTRFLRENQAMGAYLYGELILTEDYHFQNIAVQLCEELEEEFDPSLRKIVRELVVGDNMNK